MSRGDDYRYWLRFQIWLAVAGIGIWLTGAITDNSFIAGLGTGVMASALAIRLLRGRAAGDTSGGDGA